jgi:Fic family protein
MLFTAPTLDDHEREVVAEIREIREKLQPLVRANRPWMGLLRKDLSARALQGSNSIEGYVASDSDAFAVVEGEEPTDTSDDTTAALKGYRDAMSYALQVAPSRGFEYSEVLLTSLHFMMIRHDWRKHPGQWRPGGIFVREDRTGEIVYEGPPATDVPSLVGELIDWLNDEPREGSLIVRAGMAHLNLTMIHPFLDGNGRMARVLETLVMARGGVLDPPFCSIEEWLGHNTPAYYSVLGEVGQGTWQPEHDARPWVRFVIRAHYEQTHTFQRRVTEAGRLFDLLEDAAKRRGLPDRMIVALFNASLGYTIRRSGYCKYAEISDWQGSRDLRRLADEGLLVPVGEKRGRHYRASDGLREYHARAKEPYRLISDPFAA